MENAATETRHEITEDHYAYEKADGTWSLHHAGTQIGVYKTFGDCVHAAIPSTDSGWGDYDDYVEG